MKTMAAGKFKTQCLQVMESVRATREPVVITKRGRPVAKLVPADPDAQEFLGRLKSVIKITGDIESPVEPLTSWKILK
jgi:prevent-host-death family protein